MSVFSGGILVVANKANSFNRAILGQFLSASMGRVQIFDQSRGGRRSVHVTLSGSGIGFCVNSMHSHSDLSRTVMKMSCVFRTTTLGRIPSYRFCPVRTMHAGILNARGILGTTVTSNIGQIMILDASGTICPVGTVNVSGTVTRGLVITGSQVVPTANPIVYTAHCNGIVTSHNSIVPLFVGRLRDNRPLAIASPGVAHFLVSLRSSISLILRTFRRTRRNSVFIRGTPTSAITSLTRTLGRLFSHSGSIGIVNAHRKRGLCRSLVSHRRVTGTRSVKHCCHVPSSGHSLGCGGFFIRNRRRVSSLSSCASRGARQLSIRNMGGILLGLRCVRRGLSTWNCSTNECAAEACRSRPYSYQA